MTQLRSAWHIVSNVGAIDSPALLLYPDRIEQNLLQMIGLAGRPERLRPHVKTHKLAEIVRLQLALGITRFKCATLAEAEMLAACHAPDVLLACQPVGPRIGRFLRLAQSFPATTFSTVADNAASLRALSQAAAQAGATLGVFLDVDCGQHRTGVEPGPAAVELYRLLASLPGLRPAGLHAYDGHICHTGLAARQKACEAAFGPVEALRRQLAQAGLPVPTLVAGGTPTLPLHARRQAVECSPGTCVLWDHSYGTRLPDLRFQPAALVLTRVISKPGPKRLCLDLGHKAIASEQPPPRVCLLNLPDARPVLHSEEHLVIETPQAEAWAVGEPIYGVPWHICPTVALYSQAVVVRQGRATETWRVVARDRRPLD